TPADLVNRRPQLMEWAIGKGYDLYSEGTGKFVMPGEKLSWDQHLHASGEEVSAWYDNTKSNPNNPDPDQWVGYGDRTVDEMAHAWMNVVYLTDTEYKEWQDKRKARMSTDAPPQQQ
ncbi:MAG: hypothetical protein ABI039_04345, partial [Vicinamibacterales bacterium]